MTSITLKLACVAPFFLGAVACSSIAPETSSASSSELRDGVCATLDYGPTTAIDAYYRQFASDDDAAAYVARLADAGTLAGRFKEITTDARLVRLVGEVYEGFKKTFPRETAGLPVSPRVAIMENENINAFALGPVSSDENRSPWLFFVNTALLNAGSTDTQLRGVFAHELGHLVLRTFLPEIQRRVRAIYMIERSEDGVIGAVQDDDPRIALHVEEILKRQSRVSGLARLGLPIVMEPGYFKGIRAVTAQAAEMAPGAPDPCRVANEKIDELRAAQLPLIPHGAEQNYTPRTPTAEEQAHLDGLTELIGHELRTCSAGIPSSVPRTLAELTALLNRLPPDAADPAHPQHAQLLDHLLDTEKRVDAEVPDAPFVDRLLRAEAPLRRELAALQEDPSAPIDRIRVFDYEEDADDASVRVLAAIGDDPTGVGQFFLHTFLPEHARETCIRDVKEGALIAYGQMIDAHAAPCWRYYHTLQFAKALSQCTAGEAATKRAPKGTGRPSILDKTPREVTERGYGRGRK